MSEFQSQDLFVEIMFGPGLERLGVSKDPATLERSSNLHHFICTLRTLEFRDEQAGSRQVPTDDRTRGDFDTDRKQAFRIQIG
jgi:hypothetical protein